jgi:alpha-glucoside transport system substrate-binding protein
MGGISRRAWLRRAALVPLATAVGGCSAGADLVRGRRSVRVAVSWSAAELAAFRRVIERLNRLPGMPPLPYSVDPVPLGDDIAAAFAAGGSGRPDIVMLPRPGLVQENLDALAPLPDGVWPLGEAGESYAPIWRALLFQPDPGTDTRVPYGLPWKLAHKSLVWYRACLFDQHGLEAPRTWSEWVDLNDELASREIAPLAVAGGDGWMLTDFFENVLLARSPCAYDLLTNPGPRPWNAPAVREAFVLLGRMWAAPGALAGGVRRSLVQQFPDAVLEVFRYHRAAMVVVPDFAEPIVRRFGENPEGCADDVGIFAFPRIGSGTRPLVAGGDVAVLTRPAGADAQDLLRRLARPEAALEWISRDGGFIAANRTTRDDLYSREIGPIARQLRDERFRFDLSDQLGAIGSREGLWRVLQDFLARVGNGRTDLVDGAADEAISRLQAIEDSPHVDRRDLRRRALARRRAAAGIEACERVGPHGGTADGGPDGD